MMRFIRKYERGLARGAMVIVLLGIIRTIAEPLRLHYYAQESWVYEKVWPFLAAGLIASLGLLLMTFLSFCAQYKWVMLVAFLVICGMIVIKVLYLS